MTFEEANTYKTNPKYGTDRGYSINCQSCVVAFEARLRGYDVYTLPNMGKGTTSYKLSLDTALAWIDPKTMEKPELIANVDVRTPAQTVKFMHDTMQAGERYTLQVVWKGRGLNGHIVNLDYTDDGQLRLKDNQRGKGELSEFIGDKAIKEYLSRIKFLTKRGGKWYYVGPRLLRIDDKIFNEEVVKDIIKGV